MKGNIYLHIYDLYLAFLFCPLSQPLSNAYHELAQVYTTNNPAELRSLVNKHSETFTRDNNTGLVKQCLSSLYKKNIQRLTKVCDVRICARSFKSFRSSFPHVLCTAEIVLSLCTTFSRCIQGNHGIVLLEELCDSHLLLFCK